MNKLKMYILTCPDCYSDNLRRVDRGKSDRFLCLECNKRFVLSIASYREEINLYN